MTSPWNTFITQILLSEKAHYLWLRSLSYLEYIGYRKMVKALAYEQVSRKVFHHLSDEIRHSYMLKELADKLMVKLTSDVPQDEFLESIPCFDEIFINLAEGYFQDLDAQVDQWVKDRFGQANRFLCYLMTSYLIEVRAMIVYPDYLQVLKAPGEKAVVQQIIKEEREHLKELLESAKAFSEDFSLNQPELLQFEKERFEKYLADFQKQLKPQELRLSA